MLGSVAAGFAGASAGCYNPAASSSSDATLDGVNDGSADLDNDGIANAVDNCREQANPSQHDEDRDQLGDECDPCPIDVSADDEDRDGVAGSCDPSPVEKHRIVWFQRFAGSALPPMWSTVGNATIGFNGESLLIKTVEPSFLLGPMMTSEPGEIFVSFDVVELGSNVAATSRVGVMSNFAAFGQTHIECNLFRNMAVRSLGLVRFNSSTSTTVISFVDTTQALDPGRHVLSFAAAAAGGKCETSSVGLAATVEGSTPVTLTGVPGLRLESVAIAVRWMMLVQKNPAP